MKIVNVYQAKTHFSQLLDQVNQGEEVIIGKAGKPVARLIPFHGPAKPRKPGALKGKIKIAKDFDQLPDELIRAFKGEN